MLLFHLYHTDTRDQLYNYNYVEIYVHVNDLGLGEVVLIILTLVDHGSCILILA